MLFRTRTLVEIFLQGLFNVEHVSHPHHTKVLQLSLGEAGQFEAVNPVLHEAGLVLGNEERVEPVANVVGGPTHQGLLSEGSCPGGGLLHLGHFGESWWRLSGLAGEYAAVKVR